MKKILYIVSTLRKCGPTNQLSYIIKFIDRNKFEPVILTLSSEPKDSMKDYFVNILNIRVESLNLSRLKGFFLAKHKVKNFIKANKINLVHSQGIRADGIMSKIRIPRVSTLRNYPYFDYCMTYGKLNGWLMAKSHLSYLKKIDKPFVVSKSIAKMLLEKNKYDINYIRNGIDTDKFKPLDKLKTREKLNLDPKKTLFISTGHLNSRKDPLTIIASFISANLPNSELIFLGEGDLINKCSRMSNEHNNIKFLGRVNNVNEYLSAGDYFVSASHAEGLPNSVLEAMAIGLPCILSDIPPHYEINRLDKNTSWLFKTNNVENLTKLMKKLSDFDSEKYIECSTSSRNLAYKHLSAEKMSNNYQLVYKELIQIQ